MSDDQRLADLKDNLRLLYEKLGEFERELIINANSLDRFNLKQRIKREILPDIRRYEAEYWRLYPTEAIIISDEEAKSQLNQVEQAVESIEGVPPAEYPRELVPLLQDIRAKLESNKVASAKLKVVLPLIPTIASYELEMNTEGLMYTAWKSIKKLVREDKPQIQAANPAPPLTNLPRETATTSPSSRSWHIRVARVDVGRGLTLLRDHCRWALSQLLQLMTWFLFLRPKPWQWVVLSLVMGVVIGKFDELPQVINKLSSPTNTCSNPAADVTAIDFHPEGKYLAAASSDHTVRLHEVDGTNIKEICNQEKHKDSVVAIKFSKSGKYLATASLDGTAGLWEMNGTQKEKNGTEIISYVKQLQCPAYGNPRSVFHPLVAIGFSRDEKYLATGCADGTVYVWEIGSFEESKAMSKLKTYIKAVSFSADEKYVAIASVNKPAYIWNWESDPNGQKLTPVPSNNDNVVDAVFSPQDDNQYIATASVDGSVQVWDITNLINQPVPKLEQGTNIDAPSTSVSLSPNGKYVAAPKLEPEANIDARPTSVSFSPNGKYVAAISLDNKVRVWSMETGKVVLDLKDKNIVAVAFDPDEKTYLATASMDSPRTPNIDGAVKVWDIASRDEVKDIIGNDHKSQDSVQSFVTVAFKPKDGKYLAAVSTDGKIQIKQVKQ